MTLNDLLDKIKEKGIDSLSEIQLKQLEMENTYFLRRELVKFK